MGQFHYSSKSINLLYFHSFLNTNFVLHIFDSTILHITVYLRTQLNLLRLLYFVNVIQYTITSYNTTKIHLQFKTYI